MAIQSPTTSLLVDQPALLEMVTSIYYVSWSQSQAMFNSSLPHELQHTRFLCPSSSPKVCPSSCLLHWWCHPTISSSVTLFSFCPQSFLAPGSFPKGQLFTSSGQNTEASASASVLPVSIQDWFPLRWTGWISLLSKGLSSLLQHHSSKASVLQHSAFITVQISHSYMNTGKIIALIIQTII